MNTHRIADTVESFISKSKGEGSRGGHVIGHTRSGKPVYGTDGHHYYHGPGIRPEFRSAYSGFSAKDHKDAYKLHEREAHRQATLASSLRTSSSLDEHPGAVEAEQKAAMHGSAMVTHEDMAEASRHGKVIGQTISGKAVYASKRANDGAYAHFTPQDHHDALKLHQEEYRKAGKRFAQGWMSIRGASDTAPDNSPGRLKMRDANRAQRRHRMVSRSHNQAVKTLSIGKTKSGKDIFSTGAGHPEHKDFTAHDHLDAAILHHKLARHNRGLSSSGNPSESKIHNERAYNHAAIADDHMNSLRHLVTGGDD